MATAICIVCLLSILSVRETWTPVPTHAIHRLHPAWSMNRFQREKVRRTHFTRVGSKTYYWATRFRTDHRLRIEAFKPHFKHLHIHITEYQGSNIWQPLKTRKCQINRNILKHCIAYVFVLIDRLRFCNWALVISLARSTWAQTPSKHTKTVSPFFQHKVRAPTDTFSAHGWNTLYLYLWHYGTH